MSDEKDPPSFNDRPPTENQPPTPPSRAAGGSPAPVVGRTPYDIVVEVILPLLLKPRTGIPILAGVVILVAVYFMFLSRVLSYENELFRIGGSPVPQSAELKQCFEKARQLEKPYVIEAVTYLIQFDKETANNQPFFRDNRRIVYTVRALRDIKLDEKVFVEAIHSHIPGHQLTRWYGNEKETLHDQNRPEQFNVQFAMREGEIRNIVTGVNFVLPFPLQDRGELEDKLRVGPNQNYEGYGNDADVICELDIVIESKTLQISPVGDAAKRYFENSLKDEEARLGYDSSGASAQRSISARWKNVMPSEKVGILFSWPQ
jgi:hypothetical protein